MSNRPWLFAMLSLCLLTKPATGEETTPANAPETGVVLVADTAVMNGREGVAIYRGNVRISHNRVVITADEVEVRQQADGSVSSLQARGKPATASEEDSKGRQMQAQADVVTYYLAERRMLLTGNARLTQDGRVFEGNEITYDVREERMEAASAPGQRVRLVIPPASSDKTPADNSDITKSQE